MTPSEQESKMICGYVSRTGVACSKAATEDDECAGCGAFICAEHADAPWGEHDPEDHSECSVCGEAGHFDGECDE